MTDSDIQSLQAYLTNCLEPALKFARDKCEEYGSKQSSTDNRTNMIYCSRMENFYSGKCAAYEDAINGFRSLFKDELDKSRSPATCDHQWAASYTASDTVDGWDCIKCGARREAK